MDDVLTVTGFTVTLRDHIWRRFASLRVRGEVSQFQVARSGHWYFTIADPGASLSCVMFSSKARFARQQPKVGEEVVLEGHIDVYAPSGRYNLVVRTLDLGGAGRLQRQLDALRAQLREEGLFEPARKRPLPRLPRAIAVVTSPTGAALHDILEVSGKRFPAIPILLSPCKVQGEWAEKTIAQAIRRVAIHGGADVLVLARGGGSQEDLSVFNDEAVARAIAQSPIPVVSAVGHETDVTIADLVADVRAATPSHAAELVVPDRHALLRVVRGHGLHLGQSVRGAVATRRRRLARIVLRDPKSTVKLARERLVRLEVRLAAAMTNRKTRSRAVLGAHAGRLDALSPLAVLGRGYAVALKDGHAVRSASELAVGDLLELRLSEGGAEVSVRAVNVTPRDTESAR
jgi:exodeoxyribonuclease VII large subunit